MISLFLVLLFISIRSITTLPLCTTDQSCTIIESPHPYYPNIKSIWDVSYPNTSCYKVIMDERSWTPHKNDFVKLYAIKDNDKKKSLTDKLYKKRLLYFGSEEYDDVSKIRVKFKTNKNKNSYGFRLKITKCDKDTRYRDNINLPYYDNNNSNYSKYSYPAVFDLSSNLEANTGQSIGPFSFTVGEKPKNDLMSSGFEPMSFRYRFRAEQDNDHEIYTGTSIYDQYISGLFDNGTAYVYRMENGEFKLIRTSVIERYKSSGWSNEFFGSNRVIDPTVTFAAVRLPGWYASPHEYYLKVVAVDSNGIESNGSVTSVAWSNINDGTSSTSLSLSSEDFPEGQRARSHAGDIINHDITPPTDFTAVQDPATGIITLSWQFPQHLTSTISGFRIYRSSWPSSQQEGYSFALSTSDLITGLDPASPVLAGDMVFISHLHYRWSRVQFTSARVYGAPAGNNPRMTPQFYNDETAGTKSWEYVSHPTPVPSKLAAEGGRTCQAVSITDSSTVSIAEYFYGHTNQNWYYVFESNKTYSVDGWFRTANEDQPTVVSFTLNQFYNNPDRYPCVADMNPAFPFVFTVTSEWQFFHFNFTIPANCIIDFDNAIGQAVWTWSGPGTLYMDNLRLYHASATFGDWIPEDYAAMIGSGMGYLRTHQFVKTGFPYSMDGFTNEIGCNDQFGHSSRTIWTLPSLLKLVEKLSLDPWLQIEMSMTDEEWLGFIEFMCAQYNPAIDTPTTKPWAFKRFQQGRSQPWIEVFTKILIELSNETWNSLFAPWTFLGTEMIDSVTGATISGGELYGLFQERVISVMRTSPYWTQDTEQKFVFVLGGWAPQTGVSGYGQGAAVNSHSSNLVTVAGYNGGWERGIRGDNSPTGFLGAILLNTVTLNSEAAQLTQTQIMMRNSGLADFELGTYEAGPGYNINGLNGVSITEEEVEAESAVMKSPAGGVATLDTFLYRAWLGWTEQNFFNFDRNRWYWVSHALVEDGGWAYPPWAALTMFNNYATGKFMIANSVIGPTLDFEGHDDIPQITAYATVSVDNSYNLFVLSKKLNNFPFIEDDGLTNVTIVLPFFSTQEVELVIMSSPLGAMASALDSDTAPLQSFLFTGEDIPAIAPVFDVAIPAGSVYLYKFRGVEYYDKPDLPQILIAPVSPLVVYPEVNIQFRVTFDRDWGSFSASDVEISGTAEASVDGMMITRDSWSRNSSILLTISDMRSEGDVIVTIGSASSTATFVVDAVLPPSPYSPSAIVNYNTDTVTVTLEWDIIADIASYYDSATVTWGLTTNSADTWSTGVIAISDDCPRCYACASDSSAFCSKATVTVDVTQSFPTFDSYSAYQSLFPLYFNIFAHNSLGSSEQHTRLAVFQISDTFDSPDYSGGLPTDWECLLDCDYVAIESIGTSVVSPTNTSLIHFIHWGDAYLIFNNSNNPIATSAGTLPQGLIDYQYYTVRVTLSAAGSNGYNLIGAVTHFQDVNNFARIELYPTDGRFRIIGQVSGSPVYGPSVPFLSDSNEPTASTAMDVGEFWSLAVSVSEAPDRYCGPAVEIRVELTDNEDICRIDFNQLHENDRVGQCVYRWLSCDLHNIHGTFGIYSRNANGGDAEDALKGHFVDNIDINAVPLA